MHAAGTRLDRTVEVDYDVVVLDRDLPGVRGDDVCRQLVREPLRTRVLTNPSNSCIYNVLRSIHGTEVGTNGSCQCIEARVGKLTGRSGHRFRVEGP
jgi:DNA-binding NarL/FixJ family response regulator